MLDVCWFTQREKFMNFVRISMNVFPEKQREVKQTLLSMIEPIEKAA